MKSVSQEAESRRESDWEKCRKPESPNQRKPKPMDGAGARAEQRRTSVGAALNFGSNRNAGQKHESDDAPENPMKYSEDQTVRKHMQAPVVEKGTPDNRKVGKSAVAERHVQSDPGFKIADCRSAHVRSERKNTERTFDSRRKRSSTV